MPLAVLLGGVLEIAKGSRVVLVISGGNVDSLILDRIIAKGWANGLSSHQLAPCRSPLQYAKGTLSSNKISSIEEMLVIKQCTECILLADASIRAYFTKTEHLIPCFRDYVRHFIDHLIADVGKV